MVLGFTTSLRANGSRECAPDDRLREAIHLSQRRGMDCFASLAMPVDGIAPYFNVPISRKYFNTPGWISATSGAAATVFAAVVSQACDNFWQKAPSTACSVRAK